MAQLVFETGNVRFVLSDLCRKLVNLRLRVVYVLAGIILLQRSHRIGVKLLLLQVELALGNVEFVRVVGKFLILIREFSRQ